jgi:hypothetical protein
MDTSKDQEELGKLSKNGSRAPWIPEKYSVAGAGVR